MPWVRPRRGARQWCATTDFCNFSLLLREAKREQPVRAWISEEILVRSVLPFLLVPVVPAVADAGEDHTCAIKADGSLACIGCNDFGQRSVPVDLGQVISVAAGFRHTCAIKADGSLACFGRNDFGQCSVPADLGQVISVAAGFRHTCAIKADGSLACFGRNDDGQCSVPADLGQVLSVAAGFRHTCAVKADGSLACFGRNFFGQCSVPADFGPVAWTVSRDARGGAPAMASATSGASSGAPVIQDVLHREPAAEIPPAEAAEVARQQWSQSVQVLAGAASTSAASAGPVDFGDVSAATSAAALPETPECFMMHARVLTRSASRAVTELSQGDELIPGRAFHDSTVCAVRLMMRCERRVVTLHFGGNDCPAASVTLTAAHVVMVARQQKMPQQNRQVRPFRPTPVLATEVQPGDLLRGRSYQHHIHRVEHDVQDVEAVEVQLTDTRGTFFVGEPGMAPEMYVEVCGAMAPLNTTLVEIIRFRRNDRFKDIILRNPELATCIEDLEASGYSVDLGDTGLGPAKLLVRADLASRVMMALNQRYASQREQLKISDVVVSKELKPILLHEVQRRAPRANPVIREEVLNLGCAIREKRTFLDTSMASSSSGVTAHSSTDTHVGVHGNPRKRKTHP